MKTFISVTFLSIFVAGPSFARSGQCENYAKFAAIRAYMTEVSEADRGGLVSKASLLRVANGYEGYEVSVESPCTVDGDDSNCAMTFEVVVKPQGSKCSVESVKEIKE